MQKQTYISKRLLDRLVYDYLHANGFQEAASELARESKFIAADHAPLPLRQSSIGDAQARHGIRDAVFAGDMVAAQKIISKNHPQFFDNNDELLFQMRLQQLTEYIRKTI